MAAGGEQVFLVWFGVWFGDFLGCMHRLETAKAGDTEAGRISRVQNNSTESLDVYIPSSVLRKRYAVRCSCCVHLKYCTHDFNSSDNYFLKITENVEKTSCCLKVAFSANIRMNLYS